MGDDALFRRLYPEWTGETGPLITWAILVIILILVPFLAYKIQEHFLIVWRRIRPPQQLLDETLIIEV